MFLCYIAILQLLWLFEKILHAIVIFPLSLFSLGNTVKRCHHIVFLILKHYFTLPAKVNEMKTILDSCCNGVCSKYNPVMVNREHTTHSDTTYSDEYLLKQNERNSYYSSCKNGNIYYLINNTLKVIIEMVLLKLTLVSFLCAEHSRLLLSPQVDGWWLLLACRECSCRESSSRGLCWQGEMFVVKAHTSSVLGPAWVHFYFPWSRVLPSGCPWTIYSVKTSRKPLQGILDFFFSPVCVIVCLTIPSK